MKQYLLNPHALKWGRLGLLIVFALLLAACGEQTIYTGTLILDGVERIEPGERVEAAVALFGGELVVEPGAYLEGPVLIVSGRVSAEGEVGQDVYLFSGGLDLGPEARVGGNIHYAGGDLNRDPGALISGQVEQILTDEAEVSLGARLADYLTTTLPQAFLMAVLAYAALRFLPGPIERVSGSIAKHPVVVSAMGLLAGIVGLSLLVMMAFTVILIPAAIIGFLLGILAVIYGWIGFGWVTGQYAGRLLKWNLSPALAAALGTFLFILILNGLGLLWGLIPVVVSAAGLGAVLLTRFGWQRFIPANEAIQ